MAERRLGTRDLVGNRTEKRHTEALPGGGFDISIRCYKYNQGHQLVLEYEESGSFGRGVVMGLAGDEHSGLASVTVSGTPATQWGEYFVGHAPPSSTGHVVVIAEDNVGNQTTIPVKVTTGLSDFVSYRYDENGNLIERLSSSDGPTLYQWDHKNRLTKVTHPDGEETLYEYCPACPLGKLAKMTRKDGSMVEWTWDGLSMVEEMDTREGDAAYFGGLAVQRDGEWYYLMMDAMGTVFQVTDEAGALVNEFDWDAWGNEVSGTFGQEGAVSQLGWQGKRWDDEQEVFYSVARWYDQRTGRFTQPDPVEGVGIVAIAGQGYGWPGRNPVDLSDSLGLRRKFSYRHDWAQIVASYRDKCGNLVNKKMKNGQEFLDFLLEMQAKGLQVVELSIRAHGSEANQMMGDHWMLLAYMGSISLLDSKTSTNPKQETIDITNLMGNVMAAGAEINLNGCQTGLGPISVAQELSDALPGRDVRGGAGALGQIGIPGTARSFGSKYVFESGVKKYREWWVIR